VSWFLNKNFALIYFSFLKSDLVTKINSFMIIADKKREYGKKKLHKVFYIGSNQKILHSVVNHS